MCYHLSHCKMDGKGIENGGPKVVEGGANRDSEGNTVACEASVLDDPYAIVDSIKDVTLMMLRDLVDGDMKGN